MNKAGKIIILIAVVLVVIGAVLTGIALIQGGAFTQGVSLQEKTYSFALKDISSVDINTISDTVLILPAQGDEALVKTMEDDRHAYAVTLEDGTLKVSYEGNKNSFDILDFSNWFTQSQCVTVYLPAELSGSVKLSSVSGELTAQQLDATGALHASSTSGTIRLDDMRCGKDCFLSTTSGEIVLNKVTVGSTLNISTTSGKTELEEISVGGNIDMQSVSGDFTLHNTAASGDVNCSATSGKLSFSELCGSNFLFSTVSGDVSGSIAEDGREYTASCSSVSGSGGGSRSLRASTTSGEILIEFIG